MLVYMPWKMSMPITSKYLSKTDVRQSLNKMVIDKWWINDIYKIEPEHVKAYKMTWASAQSDQSPCCPPEEGLDP